MIPALIAAAATIAASRAASRSNRLANQSAASVAGEQADLQREFAQNGISWRVADAKKAGVSPVYALGAQGASYAPVAQSVFQDNSTADMIQSLGQNLSGAVGRTMDTYDRDLKQAQLEAIRASTAKDVALAGAANSEAQRSWLEFRTANPVNLDGTGIKPRYGWGLDGQNVTTPRAVSDGTNAVIGSRHAMKWTPSERTAHEPGNPSEQRGSEPAFTRYSISPWGLTATAPSSNEGYSEAKESEWIGEFLWRNTAERGVDWLNQYVQQYVFGKAPKFRQAPPPSSFKYKGGYGKGPGRGQ